MSDTNNTPEATTPEAPKSAADYIAQFEESTKTTTPPDEEPKQATTPAEDVDDDEIEITFDPDAADDDGDNADLSLDMDDDDDELEDDEYELPSLIPEIEGNPEAMAKVKGFEKGIKKLVDRVKAKEAELAQHMPRVQSMSVWAEQLEDPSRVVEAFQDLGKRLAAHHGLDAAQLLGSINAESYDDGDWEAQGYDSPGEYRAYRRALQEATAATAADKAKLEPLIKELEELKKEREAQLKRKAFESQLQEVAPKVIKRLAKTDNGWTVTPDMVAEAIVNLPQYAKDPVRAVRMWHSEARARHYAKVAAEGSRKTTPPEMVEGSRPGSGVQAPPPAQRSAIDYYRMNGWV